MSRFLIWSDLHCDVAPFDIPVPGRDGAPESASVDAVLLPGDIDVKGRHVSLMTEIWRIWQVPVLAVAGNHEPYGAKRFQKHLSQEADLLAEARSQGADIDVMRSASRIIGDTRVIGSTLWTDMNLWPESGAYAQVSVRNVMNDYARVGWHDAQRGIYRKMIPQDTVAMHHREKAYLLGELDKPFEGRTLVMTHHLPVRQMLSDRRQDRREVISSAYASDLWSEIRERKVDMWVSGHSHDCQEVVLEGEHGPVAFCRNIRGYPDEGTDFDPNRIFDTVEPALRIDPADPRIDM